MIPTETIDRVREATDIVSLVGQYVALKPSGQSFKGLCPFHTEKTPSFLVNPARQIFKCFGCGAGGNAFHFVMRMEGWSFGEAVRELAKRANLTLPTRESPEGDAQERERRAQYDVLDWAVARFQQALRTPGTAAGVQAYLQRRGVTAELSERFGLGYAPPGWDNLVRAAQRDHFSEAVLTQAGLVGVKAETGRVYDRFRDRLMFPIRDVQGRAVGFGGRLLVDGEPKYLNSPETDVFRKGEILYALDIARESVRKQGRFVLVEGYMDTIACHAAGVTETVATMGTALTPQQARLLRRYAERVVLIYDADAAGIAASLRAGEILLPAGLTVYVVALRGAKDPDEYVRNFGAEAFRAAVAKAAELVTYVLDVALAREDAGTVEGKLAVVKQLVPFLAKLPEGSADTQLRRREYAKVVATRLQLDETQVLNVLAQEIKRRVKRDGAAAPAASSEATAAWGQWLDSAITTRKEEEMLLGTLLRFPQLWERVRSRLDLADFAATATRALAAVMVAVAPDASDPAERWVQRVVAELPDPEAAAWAAGLTLLDEAAADDTAPGQAERQALRVMEDCLQRLQSARLWERIGRLQAELKAAEAQGDLAVVKQLLQQESEGKVRLKQLGVDWRPGRSGPAATGEKRP